MNLKHLEAFVRVAETKSFSEAAKKLYLTQPTVSAHIAALERELNACLLVRSTKGVALSEEGKELYAYAEQILEIEEQIRRRFGLERGGSGSVLRIAASTVPAQYLLPEIMSRFRKAYPEEKLKLFETDSAGVLAMILSHQADVGFAGTAVRKGNCRYIPFYSDELVVITPPEERFCRREGEDIRSWIRQEPVILREEGSGTRREARRLLEEEGISGSELNVVASMQNQEAIKKSVENGMGISIMSRLAAGDEIRAGRLLAFPLGKTGGKRDISLVYDEGYPLLPSAEKLIRIVKTITL